MRAFDDEIVGSPLAARVLALADAVREADGVEALSEQHRLALEHAGLRAHHLVVTDETGDAVVGYASVLGSSVELLVAPKHRGEGVGHRLAEAALAVDQALAFWAHGDLPGASRLAEQIGLERVRELWHLARDLPSDGAGDEAELLAAPLPGGERLRLFRGDADDERAWLELNARAFASHPEQGGMTLEDLRVREREPWFDPTLLWLVPDDDGALLASMWLKVSDDDDGVRTGEIYVLGVDPTAQGRGLGRALTDRALDVLAARGVDRVELYVEGANARARALYEHSGFTPVAVHAQYGVR